MKHFLIFLIFLTQTTLNAQDYKPVLKYSSEAYNQSASECCFTDWGVGGWLSKSQQFPNAKLYSLKTKKDVEIKNLVKKRPIVIEFGSVTCPAYDINIEGVKKLKKKYKGKVDFYTVYVRENHPSEMFPAHETMDQKIKSANALKKDDKLDHDILVDDVAGSFHQIMGNFGNSIYVVGKDMRVSHWSPFTNAELLDKGIQSILASNGVGQEAEFVGGTDTHPLFEKTYTKEEKMKTQEKMRQREGGGTVVNKEVLPEIQYILNSMPVEMREQVARIKKLSEDPKTNIPLTPERKKLAGEIEQLNINARPLFRERYKEWKKLNNITDDFDVADQVLKSHNTK